MDDADSLGEGALLLLDLLDNLSDGLGELEDGELVGVSDLEGGERMEGRARVSEGRIYM